MLKSFVIKSPILFPEGITLKDIIALITIGHPDFSSHLFYQLLPRHIRNNSRNLNLLSQEDAIILTLSLCGACNAYDIILLSCQTICRTKECSSLLKILQKQGIEIREY